jgi:hypothetical protein
MTRAAIDLWSLGMCCSSSIVSFFGGRRGSAVGLVRAVAGTTCPYAVLENETRSLVTIKRGTTHEFPVTARRFDRKPVWLLDKSRVSTSKSRSAFLLRFRRPISALPSLNWPALPFFLSRSALLFRCAPHHYPPPVFTFFLQRKAIALHDVIRFSLPLAIHTHTRESHASEAAWRRGSARGS